MKEIERKFLIKSEEMPKMDVIERSTMNQSYLLATDTEIRLREKTSDNVNYILTIKDSGALCRNEYEVDITKNKYNEFLNNIEHDPITKEQTIYDYNGHRLEYNVVDKGKPHSFEYVEIEFSSIIDAAQFQPPSWFGLEITSDDDYKMKNVWNKIVKMNRDPYILEFPIMFNIYGNDWGIEYTDDWFRQLISESPWYKYLDENHLVGVMFGVQRDVGSGMLPSQMAGIVKSVDLDNLTLKLDTYKFNYAEMIKNNKDNFCIVGNYVKKDDYVIMPKLSLILKYK